MHRRARSVMTAGDETVVLDADLSFGDDIDALGETCLVHNSCTVVA